MIEEKRRACDRWKMHSRQVDNLSNYYITLLERDSATPEMKEEEDELLKLIAIETSMMNRAFEELKRNT